MIILEIIKNCFAKFYQLYKDDITNDIIEIYFQK